MFKKYHITNNFMNDLGEITCLGCNLCIAKKIKKVTVMPPNTRGDQEVLMNLAKISTRRMI